MLAARAVRDYKLRIVGHLRRHLLRSKDYPPLDPAPAAHRAQMWPPMPHGQLARVRNRRQAGPYRKQANRPPLSRTWRPRHGRTAEISRTNLPLTWPWVPARVATARHSRSWCFGKQKTASGRCAQKALPQNWQHRADHAFTPAPSSTRRASGCTARTAARLRASRARRRGNATATGCRTDCTGSGPGSPHPGRSWSHRPVQGGESSDQILLSTGAVAVLDSAVLTVPLAGLLARGRHHSISRVRLGWGSVQGVQGNVHAGQTSGVVILDSVLRIRWIHAVHDTLRGLHHRRHLVVVRSFHQQRARPAPLHQLDLRRRASRSSCHLSNSP